MVLAVLLSLPLSLLMNCFTVNHKQCQNFSFRHPEHIFVCRFCLHVVNQGQTERMGRGLSYSCPLLRKPSLSRE